MTGYVKRVTRTRSAHAVLPCSGITSSGEMSLQLRVRCTIVAGGVSEEELCNWLQNAVAAYHTFRIGHVGVAADATITRPKLSLIRKAKRHTK